MRSLLLILTCFSILPGISQIGSQKTIDSLENIIETSTSDAEVGHALVILSDQYQFTNVDTMPILCFEALELVNKSPLADDDVEKIGLQMVKAEAYNNLGYYYIRKGNLEEAKTYLTKGIDIGISVNYHTNLVSAGINLSLVYGEQGDYKYAIEILEKTKTLAEFKKMTTEKATILNNIGWIYQILSEYETALSYYYRAYTIHKQHGPKAKTAAALNNLGVVYYRIGNLDSSEYYYQESFNIRLEEDDKVGLANSYANLAGVTAAKGDTAKAIEYFESSLKICRENGYRRQWMNALNGYGKVALKGTNLATVKSIMMEMDTVLPNYRTTHSLLEYYQFSYRYHDKIGDIERAYSDYKSYNSIKDTSQLITAKNEVIGRELAIQNEADKAILEQKLQHEINISKEEEKRQRLNFYITIIVLVFVLFILFFIWNNSRQRQKLSRINLELSQIKNEKLEEDVHLKNKELTSYTLRVAQNNQFIQNVDDILSSVNEASKEEIEDQLRQLKNEIKITKRKDKDWLEFQRQFEGIHTTFITGLTEKYPKLTTNEIRLCTLIKLNLPSKDIASILGVSMNTVKSSRYRIHKKIGLKEGEILAEYILRFN